MKNPFAALIGVFLTLSIAMAGCSSSSGSAESSSSEENNRVSSSQTASRSVKRRTIFRFQIPRS